MLRRTVWCTAEDWQKQTSREIGVISTSRSWTSLVCRQTMGAKDAEKHFDAVSRRSMEDGE
jgi:hypothetical protein